MKPVVGSRVTRQVTFVGPFGVGKTTAVFTLCGASVTTSEVHSSLATGRRGRRVKPTTTVGLEMGEWTAPDGRAVSVVGTPSQERFDLVRRSAMPRSSGVVLWLFGHHPEAALDAELWLEFISHEVAIDKVAVALTRLGTTAEDQAREAACREVVAGLDPAVPVLTVDPRSREDVEQAVVCALRLPATLPDRMVG